MKNYPFLIFLFLFSCAKVVAPSGGPVDTYPPEILEVLPEPGFVTIIPSEIIITFSENILNSQTAIQMHPHGENIITKGKQVILHNNSDIGLLLVTVSSSLEDLRGNRTNNPQTFVWNSIPEDSFSSLSLQLLRDGDGVLTSDSRSDFFLLPDTTSPRRTHFPDSTGLINTSWLTPGIYRIQSYEDLDKSRTWDPEREPGASSEIELVSGQLTDLEMIMTIIDSIGPRISDVNVLDSWHLEIPWNEQISIGNEGNHNITITGPDSLPVLIYGIKISSGRSSTGRLTVFTDELSDTVYTIVVEGILDLAGNSSLSDTLEFWGLDSLPSYKLSIQSAYPADGGIDIPATGPFFISFNDWVDESAVKALYTLRMVSDSSVVSGSFLRTSATSFSFTPASELLGDRQYRIDLKPGLVSLQGDTLSGKSWAFKPAWSLSPGFITGIISGTGASVVKMVVAPAGSGGETILSNFMPGSYLFEGVAGGRYTVSVFVDWNSDNIWNPGEPYGAWPGVVEVLPGIETKNINIQVVP